MRGAFMAKCAVILAGGEGKRMKSNKPKPMSEVLGRPMLQWVIDSVRGAGVENICVVKGFKKENLFLAMAGGVSTGTKNIPSYRTTQGKQIVFAGEEFIIELKQYDKYDYTKFQCIITPYNTTLNNSVAANKVSINDNVYLVNSTDILSNVTKDADLKSINLNLAIDNDVDYVIHYFTYKEEA
jgi:NDP-sugar pyrophosphorylase family protein